MRYYRCVGLLILLAFGAAAISPGKMSAQDAQVSPVWQFTVSGDSRNCGDVVMPAIAASVLQTKASFYWHLGDFRAIYDFDEDMVPPARLQLARPPLNIIGYLTGAWPDFIKNQLKPFKNLDVFLGIGNHEVIYPKTRADFVSSFKDYLDSPLLRKQREDDGDATPLPRTYFHWVMNQSADFISLDNASENTFDDAQMEWLRRRLEADQKSSAIRTVVVGMHEALPGSKGLSHSMCDSPAGVASGRQVYQLLWNLQQAGKKVYVLASHSHFVMNDVYRTSYWGDKVIPGWIVGTAGAVRYRLPPFAESGSQAGMSDTGDSGEKPIARTDVYGYLLATVMSDGSVQFRFHELGLEDLRLANAGAIEDPLVRWCFNENADQKIPKPVACLANQ